MHITLWMMNDASPLPQVLYVFDCVREMSHFDRGWLLCAEVHLSDGQPLSW